MNDEIREEIRKNLIKYRKEKGISQKELANLLNISPPSVSIWETGRNSIDINNLYNICKILDISFNDILGKYNNNKEENEEIREVNELFNKLDNEGKEVIKNTLKLIATNNINRV
ncbi:MAG: helix-turn-helix transcriptional regulator [Clostridia bacterium]|nr:helix-turn-helix transcriptional regulator [Clostridia bacterium]